MIQELLGGGGGGCVGVAGGGGEERKVSINGGAVEVSSSSEQQNLKCPRCDSSNTKFCYYNNYNLTQPRHFCKTCRRYWTKGGALRNVPIGGGCRKNKGATVSPAGGKSSTGKAKPAISDVVQSNSGNGFGPHLPSNPLIWSQPQNLLALLRATHNPNPNPDSVIIKEEKAMIGSHMAQESLLASALYGRNLNLDPLSQIPIGLSNSLWRNNHHHHQPQLQGLQNQPHQQSMLLGEVPNSGIQDLYQKFRSPSHYYADHSPATVLNNSTSSILETTPVTGGQLGYWNSPFSWSDLPTANGAFP